VVDLPADAIKDAAGNAAPAATLGNLALNVGSADDPDLQTALTVKLPKGTVIPGTKSGKASAKVKITNAGATAITKQNVPVTLYLSDNQARDAADIVIGSQTKALSLKTGKGKSLSFKFTLPTSLGTGQYFVIAEADTGNTIIEANEANNVAINAAPLEVQAAFIDLRGTVAKPTGALTPGGKASVTVAVINDGNIPVKSSVTIALAASTDSSGANPVAISSITKNLSIKNGATKNVPIKFTFPANLPAGTYFIVATITPLAGETSQSNNTAISDSIAIA
jgi:uncharacterized membrane protein